MIPNKVELDGKTIEALASDTRRDILKKLKVKSKTVSEISRELDINKSAIHKHLSILVESGLIKRRTNENEYIYYELTDKGKYTIGANENVKVLILLSSSILAFILGALQIYMYIEEIRKPTFWGGPSANIVQLIIGIAIILISVFIFGHFIKSKSFRR